MSYLYDDLPGSAKAELVQHLDSCPACRKTVGEWQTAMKSLDRWKLSTRSLPLFFLRPALKWAVAVVVGTETASRTRPVTVRFRPGGGGENKDLDVFLQDDVKAVDGSHGFATATTGARPAAAIFRSLTGNTGETVMTIRAKKADVDAFAKGDLKLEDFQKKASITTY